MHLKVKMLTSLLFTSSWQAILIRRTEIFSYTNGNTACSVIITVCH